MILRKVIKKCFLMIAGNVSTRSLLFEGLPYQRFYCRAIELGYAQMPGLDLRNLNTSNWKKILPQ